VSLRDDFALVLAAAGSGRRFGDPVPKQFQEVDGQPLYLWALDGFAGKVALAVVVVPAGWKERVGKELGAGFRITTRVVCGGDTRQESVLRGLEAIPESISFVLVHDAARPQPSAALIDAVMQTTRREGACVPVLPVSDTVKEVWNGKIIRTLDRDRLRLAQTPQGFSRSMLLQALRSAQAEKVVGTDEAVLLERMGIGIPVVEGDPNNIKVTWKEDVVRLFRGGEGTRKER
jgi:2-C-methyl-D-erythritol 4-phosphate cytidylyltransferase